MHKIGQKAENVMLQRRSCVIILNDGRRIACDRIEKVSTAVATSHSGDIEIFHDARAESIFIDDIQEIQ